MRDTSALMIICNNLKRILCMTGINEKMNAKYQREESSRGNSDRHGQSTRPIDGWLSEACINCGFSLLSENCTSQFMLRPIGHPKAKSRAFMTVKHQCINTATGQRINIQQQQRFFDSQVLHAGIISQESQPRLTSRLGSSTERTNVAQERGQKS